jgi:hypothetical protein
VNVVHLIADAQSVESVNQFAGYIHQINRKDKKSVQIDLTVQDLDMVTVKSVLESFDKTLNVRTFG